MLEHLLLIRAGMHQASGSLSEDGLKMVKEIGPYLLRHKFLRDGEKPLILMPRIPVDRPECFPRAMHRSAAELANFFGIPVSSLVRDEALLEIKMFSSVRLDSTQALCAIERYALEKRRNIAIVVMTGRAINDLAHHLAKNFALDLLESDRLLDPGHGLYFDLRSRGWQKITPRI